MEKEISCINILAIIDYVQGHYDGDCSGLFRNLAPELDALPDPESFLRDSNNWVSCKVASVMYDRASLMLGDREVAYKIGRFAVEKRSPGYVQQIIVKAFWSHKTALKHAQRINDKFNRNKRVDLIHLKRNEAVVRLHWDERMQVSKHFCLMNQGVYSYLPLIWKGRPLSLEEVQCRFEGGPYCEYHLKWPTRNRLHEIISRFFTSRSVLMESIKEMEADKSIIEQKYEEVRKLNLDLNQRIKQLMAMQETGKAIVSILDLDQLLKVIMNLLSSVCRINRAMIMLVNEEKGWLEYRQGTSFAGEISEDIKEYKVPLERVSNILVRVVNTGRSEYIPEVKSSFLRKENILVAQANPLSAFVVPLITRSKVIGVIATDAVDGEGVPKETRDTLEIFAPQIAIAIENAKLYSSLQQRMAELRRSQALLSRADKLSFLGNLAARLAHELKNPLTAIGTFLQLLPQKYDDEEFRKGFHKVALEETMRMNDLITELLDLVRPKECHFAFSDLPKLIDKMILLVSAQSKAKEIEIAHRFDETLGPVWMDSERIKQVILNLLSNAIDFTPTQGRIEVVTSKVDDSAKGEAICIQIKDNGVGIPPSNMEKIFDPFFTTKHKSTMHKGTGLGLFIAHQHMQDHNGTIEARSTPNEGTTFILTLPAAPGLSTFGEGESLSHAN